MWTILVIATAIEIAFALLRCISPVLADIVAKLFLHW
jgi:hypothetical protein